MIEASPQAESRSPGQQIRAAREATGLHIVALAAALKVPVRKLEALESDRWEELTDPTFTRALASSVARHLKLDATWVLAGLPTTNTDSLNIPEGLGQANVRDISFDWRTKANPVALGVAGLLVLAICVYFFPSSWVERPQNIPNQKAEISSAKVAEAVGTPMGTTETVQDVPSATQVTPAPSPAVSTEQSAVMPVTTAVQQPQSLHSAISVNASPAGKQQTQLTLVLKGQSWVEVTDAAGKLRLQRIATAGESLRFDDAASYSVVLGNASVVDVQINGQSKDMSEFARNNVARFQAR